MTPFHKISMALTLPLLLNSVALNVWAEDNDGSVRALSQLFTCTEIEQDDARLECQDAEIQKLRQAVETKKVVVIDEVAAKDITKKSFGLSLPKLGIPVFGNRADRPKAVFLAVASIQKSGRNLTIKMKDGQIWQTLETDYGRIPKGGELEAKIKSAAFGSFLMTLSNGKRKSRTVRVRRIE